jgi:hypothetical protein
LFVVFVVCQAPSLPQHNTLTLHETTLAQITITLYSVAR